MSEFQCALNVASPAAPPVNTISLYAKANGLWYYQDSAGIELRLSGVDHTTRTAGTGAAGTTDTYTLWGDAAGTLNLGTYTVTNGADGLGSGDMLAATYDPTAKAADAFAMVNMAEGLNANVLTDLERTAIAANTAKTSYPVADSNKLAGIATAASANSSDATLLARANHTGTQLLSTISDAGTAASKNVPATGDALAGEVVLGNDSRLVSGGGGTTWLAKNITYTATASDGIAANTSTAALTVILPSILAIGDTVSFIDAAASWGTNNLTIATSAANTIMGVASPLIADVSATPFSLIAVSLTDWRLF